MLSCLIRYEYFFLKMMGLKDEKISYFRPEGNCLNIKGRNG